jgi:membrane-bound lytic murein transglycosylase F
MTKKLILLLTLFAAIGGASRATPPSSTPEKFSAPWRGYVSVWNSPEKIISEYDPIIKQAASEGGFDWRLISAIAMQESRFDHDVVSRAGAVGLMQVMPSVAKGFKVQRDQMTDPLTNVQMGVDLLEQISATLRFPRLISERDRLSITLAAYNCGIGRVLDARRLALKYGENHNSWSVVSKYLILLGDPAYYEDPVVKVGHFSDNAQTLGFVRNVLRYYDSYCEIAAL